MSEELQDKMRMREQQQAGADASQSAQRMASQKVSEHLQNPEFLDKLRDADVDSDLFPWVEDELGPLTSGAHIIGNRSRGYEREAKWINLNRAERLNTEANPGRLLRENESMLKIAQGADHPEKEMTEPKTQDEKRVTRDAMEVVTNLQTLAVENKGLESVTTATAENRVVRSEQEDTSSTRAKLREFYK